MAIRLSYDVPALEIWTTSDGKLREGIIEYGWFDTFDDVKEAVQYIKENPGKRIFLKLYGFNLVTLRGAFDGC